MKLLIIITKHGRVEFNNYWYRANGKEYELIPNDLKLLFLIKPNAFTDETTNNQYYNRDDFWEKLKIKLIESINEKKLNTSAIKEIGVVAHAGEAPDITNQFKELGNNIIFKKVYHSSTNELWKGAGSPATICEGSLPFDKLRDAVCYCENSNFDKAFDEVWNFFLGDPALEAKLELLHQCLTPNGISEAKNTYNDLIKLLKEDEKKNIQLAFEKMKKIMEIKDVKCLEDEDVNGFPRGYVGTLETLRKSLLE